MAVLVALAGELENLRRERIALMALNDAQRVASQAYEDGGFEYGAETPGEVGDTLFEFVMRELSDKEGCDSLETASQRMPSAHRHTWRKRRCLTAPRTPNKAALRLTVRTSALLGRTPYWRQEAMQSLTRHIEACLVSCGFGCRAYTFNGTK